MLVLSRFIDEEIYITIDGELVKVQVIDIKGNKVKLGFEASRNVSIHRKEIYEAIQKRDSKKSDPK